MDNLALLLIFVVGFGAGYCYSQIRYLVHYLAIVRDDEAWKAECDGCREAALTIARLLGR